VCWWMIVVVAGRETGGGRCYHFALGLVRRSFFGRLFYAHRFGPLLYVVRFLFSFSLLRHRRWLRGTSKEGKKEGKDYIGKEEKKGGKEGRKKGGKERDGGREEGRMSRKDGRPGERRTREKRIPTPERASCLCRRKEGMKEGRKEGQGPRLKEGGTVRRTEGPCERSKEGREEGRKDYVSRKGGLYFKDYIFVSSLHVVWARAAR
jgi:hypothetical protein